MSARCTRAARHTQVEEVIAHGLVSLAVAGDIINEGKESHAAPASAGTPAGAPAAPPGASLGAAGALGGGGRRGSGGSGGGGGGGEGSEDEVYQRKNMELEAQLSDVEKK